jgi:hypothetical protein
MKDWSGSNSISIGNTGDELSAVRMKITTGTSRTVNNGIMRTAGPDLSMSSGVGAGARARTRAGDGTLTGGTTRKRRSALWTLGVTLVSDRVAPLVLYHSYGSRTTLRGWILLIGCFADAAHLFGTDQFGRDVLSRVMIATLRAPPRRLCSVGIAPLPGR